MENFILVYDNEELDEFIVPDYKSREINIYYIIEEMITSNTLTDYIYKYQIMENDKLERISYELYGTSIYWDLLLSINNMSPLFDMPYTSECIMDSVEKDIIEYKNEYINSIDENRFTELSDELINKETLINQEKQFIYVVSPNYIMDFIKLLRDGNYI